VERENGMLRVGVPEAVNPELHRLLPPEISLVSIPRDPKQPLEVDFWIAPGWPGAADRMWPWLRGVRVVQSILAGVDWLRTFLPRDVILCDAGGVHSGPAAEWVVSAILASYKHLQFFDEVRCAGTWARRKEASDRIAALDAANRRFFPPAMVEELCDRHALIVGYGDIGKAIEARLQPFGVTVDRIARRAREGVAGIERLHDLLPAADIVVLAVPFTSETVGLIGERELALMKKGSLLVNVARGPVVRTDALLGALHSGRIRAALDVTDPEPLPDGHPLWAAPNLLLTPHVAGATPQFMARAMRLAGEQVGRYLRGEPLINVVSGEY
jgi:phosphoglycerate dehydrogenase-like enzyme